MSIIKTADLFAGKMEKPTASKQGHYERCWQEYYCSPLNKKTVNEQFKNRKENNVLLMSEYCLDIMDECRKRVISQYSTGKRERALAMLIGERENILQVAVPLQSAGGCMSMPKTEREGFALGITELVRNDYRPAAMARITYYNPFDDEGPTSFQREMQKAYPNTFFISLGRGRIRVQRMERGIDVSYSLKIV